METVIHTLLILFARFPKLGGLFGLITALAFGYLGITSWYAVQKMPEKPTRTALLHAASLISTDREAWVEIENVIWDCQNIVYSDVVGAVRTEVIFTDETVSILGVALFSRSKGLSCGDLKEENVTGILSNMGEGFYRVMPKRGFNIAKYQNVPIKVNLCTFCGRSNSILLVICGLVMVPSGLAMYPLCLSLGRHYEKRGLL